LFTCMLHDISERKRVERLKSEFISTVSHELRTPLTSIGGALGLIAGGVVGEISEEVRELVDISRVNADRLTALVNDILDIEKLESGQIDLRRCDTDVWSLLQQAMAHNAGYAERFGVRLVLEEETRPAEPVMVFVDPSRLLQVLANLMSNAIKFSPPAGKVVLTLERDAANVKVVVYDQGPGIPEDFRSRIFQKFAQADGTDTRQRGGTGLGLSISKAIVERLGGTIGFEPNPGGGTRFFFSLPIAG
jgi:signal transduction histidine kinase